MNESALSPMMMFNSRHRTISRNAASTAAQPITRNWVRNFPMTGAGRPPGDRPCWAVSRGLPHPLTTDQAIERCENSQRMMPKTINPTKPLLPSWPTRPMMLPTTPPKNGRVPPTSIAATIASASNIKPISVRPPIHILTRTKVSIGFPPPSNVRLPPGCRSFDHSTKALFNVDAQKTGISPAAADAGRPAPAAIDNPGWRRSDPPLRISAHGRDRVAKFRIATPAGASFTVAGGGYGYEMEALAPIDAEIFEIPAGSEDEFVAAARTADALYAKGRPISQRMIDGLERCKIIALGSVGVDSVNVDAATAKGIPVTNCPDTFIEEVADHAMRLILATHGRLVVQDRLVREGRWAEGRPMLLQIPRLRGLTLGLIAFGHVARAVAERAKPFGLHIIAYDPFIEEMVMTERGVEPVSLPELLARADIISMHSPATASAQRMIRDEHFAQMKPTAIYISTGRGPTTDEAALIKALDDKKIAAAGLDVLEQEPPGGNNPLLRMDNVILTAHVASATARFDPFRRRRVGLELSLALTGKWPMSCVNPSVLMNSGLKRWQPVSMERGPNS